MFYLRHGCFISLQAKVQFTNKIALGKGIVVKSFAVIQTSQGHISIGKNCAISSFNIIANGNSDLVIEDNVRIGPSVVINGSQSIFQDRNTPIIEQGYTHKGIRIGSDVLIGAGAIILDGCHVGKGCVIGAGSVVNKDIPPYSIVVGMPAKVIGERKEYEDQQEKSIAL